MELYDFLKKSEYIIVNLYPNIILTKYLKNRDTYE